MKLTSFKTVGTIFLFIACILFEIGYNLQYVIPNLDILPLTIVMFTFLSRILLYSTIVSGYYFIMKYYTTKNN